MRSVQLALVVLASACAPNPILSGGFPPPDELAGTTPGVNEAVGFSLGFVRAAAASAAGGAATPVSVIARSTSAGVASVHSSNDAVLTVTSDSGTTDSRSLTVLSGAAGSADLIAIDPTGAELDRLTFTVAPSTALALDSTTAATTVTVLAGAVQKLHVTTIGADGPNDVLVGTGAVKFALDPALAPATAADAPFWYAYGDEAFFTASAAGAGSVTASAPDTTTALTLTAVDPSAIDTITLTQTTELDTPALQASASIGSTPVYGVRCTWTGSPGLTVKLAGATGTTDDGPDILQTGGLGDDSAFLYELSGAPGTYDAACTIPGGLAKTISVTLGS